MSHIIYVWQKCRFRTLWTVRAPVHVEFFFLFLLFCAVLCIRIVCIEYHQWKIIISRSTSMDFMVCVLLLQKAVEHHKIYKIVHKRTLFVTVRAKEFILRNSYTISILNRWRKKYMKKSIFIRVWASVHWRTSDNVVDAQLTFLVTTTTKKINE